MGRKQIEYYSNKEALAMRARFFGIFTDLEDKSHSRHKNTFDSKQTALQVARNIIAPIPDNYGGWQAIRSFFKDRYDIETTDLE